jgi:porin
MRILRGRILAIGIGAALSASPVFAQETQLQTSQTSPDQATPPPGSPQINRAVPGGNPQDINPATAVGVPSPSIKTEEEPRRSGPLAGIADDLAAYGIGLHALYLNAMEDNISTGEKTGRLGNTSELRPGIDFDLGRIAGLSGGQIHVDESFLFFRSGTGHAPNWTSAAGGYFSANPLIESKQSNYLTTLSYEQKLFDDRVDIEVGRINANHYFDLPNCTVGLTCGDPIEMLSGGGAPPLYSFWGGRAVYKFTSRYYTQVGAFENDPDDTATHGGHLSVDTAAGAKIVGELGYRSTFLQEAYPANVELIGVFNTDHLKSFDDDTAQNGTASVLTRLQKTIWRADGGTGSDPLPENLTAYGSLSADPDKFEPYQYFAQGGLTWTGFLPDRPLDRIGVMASWVYINGHELHAQREARVAVGGPNVSTPNNSYSLELDGSFFLTPAVALQTFAEYNINNDTFFNPRSRTIPQDGVVVGATLVVYLGRLLGLSSAPEP